jgi:ribose transport system substrate-binding protein
MNSIKALALLITGLVLAAPSAGLQAKNFTIAVIPKGTTHEFWKSVQAGAVQAEREFSRGGDKVRVLWRGPIREDDRDQQIQVVETFTARNVDGIVLAPLDSQAMVRPVLNAIASGIPVIVFDSDLNSDKQVSFVATDNFKGGQMAGEYMAKRLNGKGKVILLRYQVGSASTELREAGFLDALKKHSGIEVISQDRYAGPTRETAYQTAQNLLTRYGNEVNGVFAPNETSTIAMTKALRDIGRAGGHVQMVGFDAGSQSIADLKSGDVQALVVQDPMRMGYLGVATMLEHLKGKKVEKRIDTGVILVTTENMNDPEPVRLLNPPIKEILGE